MQTPGANNSAHHECKRATKPGMRTVKEPSAQQPHTENPNIKERMVSKHLQFTLHVEYYKAAKMITRSPLVAMMWNRRNAKQTL